MGATKIIPYLFISKHQENTRYDLLVYCNKIIYYYENFIYLIKAECVKKKRTI